MRSSSSDGTNYFTFPDDHPTGWTVRKPRGTSPGSFETLEDARHFSDTFFTYYNTEHRHSGIGLHTPASVHDGTAWAIQTRRQQVLDEAFAAHPERFRGRSPLTPALPAKVWINKPRPAVL